MKEQNRPVYVQLPIWLDLSRYKKRYERGMEPEETPYGFHHAKEFGYSVFFPDNCNASRLSISLERMLGFDLLHALRHRGRMRRAEAIWTMVESDWLAISLLQRLRLVPAIPMVGNSVFMFNNWRDLNAAKKILYKALFARNVFLTVHSDAVLGEIKRSLPWLNVSLIKFGISTDTFSMVSPRVEETDGRAIRIFAAGSDRNRDWQTLMDAFGNDDRFELRIMCWRLKGKVSADIRNVTLQDQYSMNIMKGLYTWADFVIVPMRPNLYSGITVLLEAVAMGRPVISSDTGGCRTYFGDAEVTYVPPCDPAKLRDAVLSSDSALRLEKAIRAQERFVLEDYSSRGMMRRYSAVTDRLLASSIDRVSNQV